MPDIKLLTPAEIKELDPIVSIYEGVLLTYQTMIVTEENRDAINALENDAFRRLCTERGIDVNSALRLADRLQRRKWFSTFQTGAYSNGDFSGKDKTRPFLIFSIITSDDPEEREITFADSPEFYRVIQDTYENPRGMSLNRYFERQREALDLPEKYRYIDYTHLMTLYSLVEVFRPQQGAPGGLRIVSRRLSRMEYPLDKPNTQIWNLITEDTNGQIRFDIAVEDATSKRKKKEINILYAINFDELPKGLSITKRLEPYDKLVYIAIGALYNAGHKAMTVGMIYSAMGYTGRPSSTDIKKIDQSITKMSSAHIFLDNTEEIQSGYSYPSVRIDSSLLPMERVSLIVNGQVSDLALKLYREPPMISFAKDRKQVTTIEPKLLQAPVSKTNQNLLIQDYLIERIARAKNGKGSTKILYSTMYERANITTAKQKQRAPAKVKDLLDHYVSCNFITGYTMNKDGITIAF